MLIEGAIFLADYMVAHAVLVEPQVRMEEAIARGGYGENFVWWYKRLYGEKSLERIEDPNDIARKVYERTKVMIAKYEMQVRPFLGIDQDTSMLAFVQQQIEDRYQAHQ